MQGYEQATLTGWFRRIFFKEGVLRVLYVSSNVDIL